jgi:DNA polymerase III gamma/tau subunit
MRRVFGALAAGDARAALAEAGEILDAGTDPAELLRQCLRHAHDLMVAKAEGPREGGAPEMRRALDEQAKSFSDATLVHAVTVFGEALKNAKLLGEGRLFAETALARLAGHRDMRFLDQMVRELSALEKRLGAGPAPAAPASAPPPAVRAEPPVPASAPRAETRPPVPEPVAQVAEAPPAPAPAAEGLTADAVRGRWGDVLEAVRSQSKLRAALAAATVVELRGDVLVLSMPPGSAFQRAALSGADAREPLAAVFEKALGRRLGVEAVERAPDPASPAAEGEPARRPAGEGERLTAAERAAAEEAPITRLVEKELRARIVHMERQD